MACKQFAKLSLRNVLQGNKKIVVNAANSYASDTKTHTGQDWDVDDYRNCRFLVAPKQTNKNWAIKLVNEIPSQLEKDRVIFCDGGGGPLGHPKVYINLDQKGEHTCGYCGKRFHKDHHH